MLDNGEVCEFENGVYQGIKEKVSVGDVLVDGSIIGDINEVVLKDRELLSQEGVVLVALTIDSNKRDILSIKGIIAIQLYSFSHYSSILFQRYGCMNKIR